MSGGISGSNLYRVHYCVGCLSYLCYKTLWGLVPDEWSQLTLIIFSLCISVFIAFKSSLWIKKTERENKIRLKDGNDFSFHALCHEAAWFKHKCNHLCSAVTLFKYCASLWLKHSSEHLHANFHSSSSSFFFSFTWILRLNLVPLTWFSSSKLNRGVQGLIHYGWDPKWNMVLNDFQSILILAELIIVQLRGSHLPHIHWMNDGPVSSQDRREHRPLFDLML